MKELPLKPEYTPPLYLAKHDNQVLHTGSEIQDVAGVFVLGQELYNQWYTK
jgi:hypothetical protein